MTNSNFLDSDNHNGIFSWRHLPNIELFILILASRRRWHVRAAILPLRYEQREGNRDVREGEQYRIPLNLVRQSNNAIFVTYLQFSQR